ncbi:hypothetical protein ACFQ48_09490 [Hymenobacter caeli]|uniref:SGNH/GDSL hydrolase family protein n=1 Tax=Hymenobacter caeli TaxID=2735894 RepID=A0ABX2FPC7_9BACT|nr:SGNH/GDSL hydrolase family protein [Hymenobacter caeli]NRT18302.1 hypothetical protein [Hymenobacter caeli]
MKQVEIVVLGGCHVLGWPNSETRAFPALLSELIGAAIVARVPHLKLVQLAEKLAVVDELRPSHVVLQLGNYEFTAYLKSLIHQFSQVFDAPFVAQNLGLCAAEAPAGAGPAAGATPPAGRPAHCARVAAAGALVGASWLFSRRYRASFRALRACVQRHPATNFIFLSPLPCLPPADNALRRLGGWLLRHRMPARPNVHWLDSHQLLPLGRGVFADPSHLNDRGHRVLAYGLAAAFFNHLDYLC